MLHALGRFWKTGSGVSAGILIVVALGGLPVWADTPAHPAPATNAQNAPSSSEAPAPLQYDKTRYMAPDELTRGMKGYGRTVMAGTEIETFQFEVISVLKNAFEPKQDVILARCSGLNLELSGVAAGMSGSPCYIRDEAGRERMIGAVAFGWSLSKAPICGIQPITQMLSIPDVRKPENRPKRPIPGSQPAGSDAADAGRGFSVGELIARVHPEPIDSRSRLSVFNDDVAREAKPRPHPSNADRELQPLTLPVMVSGASARAREWMQDEFGRLGLELVASGSASGADKAAADKVRFEPGSVLCVPLLTGDMNMEVIGTCTEVIGDRVIGFGHSLFARGYTELPLATGMIHTVFPSISESFKIGTLLRTVGTLWGDEKTGVFGVCGPPPATAPLKVTVRDIRGRQAFNYQMTRDPTVAAMLLGSGVAGAIFCHNEPPQDHVIKYRVRINFEGAGTYETANFTSYIGVYGLAEDLLFPAMILSDSPFGDAKISSASVDVEIDAGTRTAHIDRLKLSRLNYKPGETITASVRWRHDRIEPAYTEAAYDIALPSDLKDGDYTLTVGSARTNLMALRSEKPHKFRVENLPQAVEALNFATSFPQNRLYIRLAMPKGGMAVGREEMPDLPSYRQKILLDSRRNDVGPYTEALVTQHDTDFVVNGEQSVTIKVSRKAEY